jgi:hypothetical protein
MAVNGLSIGKDVRIDLVTATGALDLGKGTGFMAKQEQIESKVKFLDGSTRVVVIPDGWSGTLDYERMGPQLDNYFADREAAYEAGTIDERIFLTQTIAEPDGSITQFRYESVVLKYDDAGSWAGESTVKQKVSWTAGRRRRVV